MPSHLEKLEAVRQAIIRAVPEIVELKMGCVIDWGGSKHLIFQRCARGKRWQLSSGTILREEEFKIIGRPIQLHDVLRTVHKKYGGRYSIQSSGHFMWYGASNEASESIDWNEVWADGQRRCWDLSKTYEEQPEPVINFLHEILCV